MAPHRGILTIAKFFFLIWLFNGDFMLYHPNPLASEVSLLFWPASSKQTPKNWMKNAKLYSHYHFQFRWSTDNRKLCSSLNFINVGQNKQNLWIVSTFATCLGTCKIKFNARLWGSVTERRKLTDFLNTIKQKRSTDQIWLKETIFQIKKETSESAFSSLVNSS